MKRYLHAVLRAVRIPCFLVIMVSIYFLILVSVISIERWKPNFSIRSWIPIERSEFQYNFLRKQNKLNTFNHKKYKLILLWSHVFKELNMLENGKDSFRNSNCWESRCELTDNRTQLLESDAILFHIRTMSLLDIPKLRHQHQKWVFFSLEAPPYSQFNGFQFMHGMFNWTMTYREDSDIFIPYGTVNSSLKSNLNSSNLFAKWKTKTKMAIWMASHCSTFGNRELYVKLLQKHIDIDTYGFCGSATCSFNATHECLKNFSRRYFFFLAFENSICDDYVTEKFFRALKYDIIPIVFGGANYAKVAPPNSYINAMDFASPKELSNHLYRVASNFSLFSSYFSWRSEGFIVHDSFDYCGLCEQMHSKSFQKHSVYYNINDWWVRKSHCQKWKGA